MPTTPTDVLTTLALLLVAAPGGAALDVVPPLAPTDRTIDLEVVVESDPDTLFGLFSTAEGLRILFPGVDARIGSAVGGDYVVAFDPEHPAGDVNGTAGCKIIAREPGRYLAFQWRGPVWAVGMNVEPLPTWVEVDLLPAGSEGPTRVRLRHHGFAPSDDGEWDRSYAFFDRGWGAMLDRLRDRFASRPDLGTP